jgi:hypothetical protein
VEQGLSVQIFDLFLIISSTFAVNFIYCREYRRDPDDNGLCAPDLALVLYCYVYGEIKH